jgi:hypothetical protein
MNFDSAWPGKGSKALAMIRFLGRDRGMSFSQSSLNSRPFFRMYSEFSLDRKTKQRFGEPPPLKQWLHQSTTGGRYWRPARKRTRADRRARRESFWEVARPRNATELRSCVALKRTEIGQVRPQTGRLPSQTLVGLSRAFLHMARWYSTFNPHIRDNENFQT